MGAKTAPATRRTIPREMATPGGTPSGRPSSPSPHSHQSPAPPRRPPPLTLLFAWASLLNAQQPVPLSVRQAALYRRPFVQQERQAAIQFVAGDGAKSARVEELPLTLCRRRFLVVVVGEIVFGPGDVGIVVREVAGFLGRVGVVDPRVDVGVVGINGFSGGGVITDGTRRVLHLPFYAPEGARGNSQKRQATSSQSRAIHEANVPGKMFWEIP